jgi:peptidoglycan/xylan/chitin deacetylase (PgdA/CDA1 family)
LKNEKRVRNTHASSTVVVYCTAVFLLTPAIFRQGGDSGNNDVSSNNQQASADVKQQTQNQTKGYIIFRLDDVQDYYSLNGTMAVMDLFIKKRVPLVTAIIAGEIGSDSSVINKTMDGIKAGLFEIALHGYHHVDYTKLSPNYASESMTRGNMILKKLFGIQPLIFVPPYNSFNDDTLDAVRSNKMNIISSSTSTEADYNKKRDLFNTTEGCGEKNCNKPIHVSPDAKFREITDDNITQLTNLQILKEIADNVKHYGYSLLILHPQDFVFTDAKTGEVLQNVVQPHQIEQLSKLVDKIQTQYNPVKMEGLIYK